jgi:xanthine dehydrogenase accessory factor
MNTPDLLATAQRLQQQGEPFALVSVLRVQLPASARPGDKAIVNGDGLIQGWIGGGCTQPAVQKAVRLALADGRARMVRIAPAAEGSEPRELDEVLEFGMSCHSGGTVELFVDPIVPPARLVIIGASPVAATLAQLAPRVGFSVTVVAQGAVAADWPDADQVLADDDIGNVGPLVAPGSSVVVATQGRRDVQGLRLALALKACEVSFVASHRKADVLRASLLASGADAADVAAIVAPAGYPMAATTPQEIALSVLAAVVAKRRGALAAVAPRKAAPAQLAAQPLQVGSGPSSCCEGGRATSMEPLPAVASAGCCSDKAIAASDTPVLTTLSVTADEAETARAALAMAVAATPKSCCGG